MDLKDFASTLLRRWYLTLGVLIVALAGGFGVAQVTGPTYTATASIVLIPPESRMEGATKASDYAPTNPLMYLGGLTQSRDLLISTIRGQQVSEAIEQRFPGVTYEVTPDATSSGPVLVMTVKTGSADQVMRALEQVMATATTELRQIQTSLGIASDNQIGSFRLATDVSPTVQRKSQLQLAVVATAGIALLGLLLLALGDHLSRSRPSSGRGSHRRTTRHGPKELHAEDSRVDEQTSETSEVVERRVLSRSGGPPSTRM